MIKETIFKSISFGLVFGACHAASTVDSYNCKIYQEYSIDGHGGLIQTKSPYSGESFIVNKNDGRIRGGLSNSEYPTITILDPGGTSHSFKLLWLSEHIAGTEGGRHANYLAIKEYVKGTLKPFTLITTSRVLSGICDINGDYS